MTHRGQLVLLPPNRVWRTYPGGRTLDELAGAPAPADTHLAEDWIASTTRAVNPGRDLPAEGGAILPVDEASSLVTDEAGCLVPGVWRRLVSCGKECLPIV